MALEFAQDAKNIVEKSEFCNHIAYTCGKHLCYYCGAGPFNNSDDCNKHLSEKHDGHSNNPPNYRKYKGEGVSDDEHFSHL